MTRPDGGGDDLPDDDDGVETADSEETSPWPLLDPEALKDKHFMVAPDVPGSDVAVTVREGPVQSAGAPFEFFSA